MTAKENRMIARIRLVLMALVASAILALPAAWANPPARTAAPKKTAAPASAAPAAQSSPRVKTLIFGEGSELEGAVVGPGGETVEARIDLVHSSLIRVRTSFLREIHKTAEDL
jgi:hypothetical protein